MNPQMERCESGPADADRTVLLLPGGLNRARSFAEVMGEPALADVHLVAATLPGHGGTPAPDDAPPPDDPWASPGSPPPPPPAPAPAESPETRPPDQPQP